MSVMQIGCRESMRGLYETSGRSVAYLAESYMMADG